MARAARKRPTAHAAADDLLSIPDFLQRRRAKRPAAAEPAPPPPAKDEDEGGSVTFEGLTYHQVYYVNGVLPKGSSGRFDIKDPPNAGYSHAFVFDNGNPKKRITLFCPFTLKSYQIGREASEVGPAEEITAGRMRRLTRIITGNWNRFCAFGYQADYDIAALVLTKMGQPVPTTVAAASEEVRQRKEETKRGKLPADHLLRVVNRESKRGKVCGFFLGEPRSLREGMATLDMTRSGILTHLHGLNKDHGLGYTLVGDTAAVDLPKGCEDPFTAPKPRKGERPAEPARTSGGKGKPLQKDVTALKKGSKRASVAEQLLDGWKALAAVAEAVGCSAASVKSHLHDLHTKHGLGYEMDDRGRARLLAPKGWRPE